jgi:hypothetical protein
MNPQKPQNISEYKKWLFKSLSVEISSRHRNHYETVTSKVRNDFENSRFWIDLRKDISDINDQYLIVTGYHLLLSPAIPELSTKPFDSFFLKTYRKNVLENQKWPNPPDGEWILPNNWFQHINDTVRTCFVVKFLDGVEFLMSKMDSICSNCHLLNNIEYEAREDGYYAAHLSILQQFDIPKIDFETEKSSICVEIQITTQLQDVIRRLLHKYYEDKRVSQIPQDVKWQWNYKSAEFSTNYLGHILHYVEGMIVEIRDEQNKFKGGIR